MTSIFKEESGQGMVEYSLILGLISLGIIGILGGIGGGPVKNMYEYATGKILGALGGD